MAKAAIYAEEAKRLFVVEGFSLDAIVGMLNKKVSRKTLYNWKTEGDWEGKRKEYLEQTRDMRDEIVEIAKLTIKEAKERPTPKALLAMCRAISALKSYDALNLLDDETTDEQRQKLTKDLSPETLEHIKKAIYGLS